jgi:hypothetical protein
MMDNLNLHRISIVMNLIHSYEHQIVYRAPYWSCDGAIENAFNTIQTKLQMDPEAFDSIHGLVNKINSIVGDMTPFKPYIFYMYTSLVIDIYGYI